MCRAGVVDALLTNPRIHRDDGAARRAPRRARRLRPAQAAGTRALARPRAPTVAVRLRRLQAYVGDGVARGRGGAHSTLADDRRHTFAGVTVMHTAMKSPTPPRVFAGSLRT